MEKTFTTVMMKALEEILEEAKKEYYKEIEEKGFTFVAQEVLKGVDKKVA